ncbi:hypothetical protein [Halorubrum sp. Hd13]|uniref:DUF7544 domain-containing protein n=1 Tax=Halorubrum sp. Hd13 TaxID=1480728 RepID=UPI000B9925ED|nr:hypothetical protein [Halorubrum sp. Hd13]OYR45964.1 hypothetical protein DJ81_03955 [Halorubrum sp. Hd13]
MALRSVENVAEAFGVTREFLTPIDVRRWRTLALVALFIGGGVSSPTAQLNMSTRQETSVNYPPLLAHG